MTYAIDATTLMAARRFDDFEQTLLILVASLEKLSNSLRVKVRARRDPETYDETFIVEVIAPPGTDQRKLQSDVDRIFNDDENLDSVMFPPVIPSVWVSP